MDYFQAIEEVKILSYRAKIRLRKKYLDPKERYRRAR